MNGKTAANITMIVAQAKVRQVREERILFDIVLEFYRQAGRNPDAEPYMSHVRQEVEAGRPLGYGQHNKLVAIVERDTGRSLADILRAATA